MGTFRPTKERSRESWPAAKSRGDGNRAAVLGVDRGAGEALSLNAAQSYLHTRARLFHSPQILPPSLIPLKILKRKYSLA
jgi:hypothetical protein